MVTVLSTSVFPVLVLFLWFSDHRLAVGIVCIVAIAITLFTTRHADPDVMRPVTPEQSRRSRALTYAALAFVAGVLVAGFIWAAYGHKP